MKLSLIKTISALSLTLSSAFAMAAPINGSFALSGGVAILGGGTIAEATGLDFLNSPANPLTDCVGDIASILGGSNCSGATAILGDIPVNTIPLGSGVALPYSDSNWIVVSAGGLTFALSNISAYEHSVTFKTLLLKGTGVMSATGWDSTPGEYTFAIGQAGQSFSFASQVESAGKVPVPASAALLGLGLLGLGAARRNKKA